MRGRDALERAAPASGRAAPPRPAAAPLLEVEGLTAGFGVNQVLHGVRLRLDQGRVGVLLGLNGAGKSVTLMTISGLLPAWGGSARLEGRELLHLETEDRVRAGLNHVLQTGRVFPEMTVEENLRLGGAVLRDRARYRDALARVLHVYPWIADRRPQAAGRLSGGEQAMLAVARALMAEPRLLLLDEPSAGLAPRTVATLFDTLRRVRETGVGMLVVEQNVTFGLAIADRAFILEKGRVVYDRDAGDLDNDRVSALLGIGSLLAAPPARAAGGGGKDPARGRPRRKGASARSPKGGSRGRP